MGIAWPITIALVLALWFNSTCKGENNKKGVGQMNRGPKCVITRVCFVGSVSYTEPWYIPELYNLITDESWNADSVPIEAAAFWKLQGEILGSMVGEC
jgi:hypothetical protein